MKNLKFTPLIILLFVFLSACNQEKKNENDMEKFCSKVKELESKADEIRKNPDDEYLKSEYDDMIDEIVDIEEKVKDKFNKVYEKDSVAREKESERLYTQYGSCIRLWERLFFDFDPDSYENKNNDEESSDEEDSYSSNQKIESNEDSYSSKSGTKGNYSKLIQEYSAYADIMIAYVGRMNRGDVSAILELDKMSDHMTKLEKELNNAEEGGQLTASDISEFFKIQSKIVTASIRLAE